MQTLRNKPIEQILILAQEADVAIAGFHGDGVIYRINLDRRFIESVLNRSLPEPSELLAEYDGQKRLKDGVDYDHTNMGCSQVW